MIVGDRRALKATLTQGISNILRELVDLYGKNLNQLSIQTAVLAGLAFNGAIQPNYYKTDHFSTEKKIYAGVFHTLIQFAMILSFLAMVVSTLASQYGPGLALTGKDAKVIVYAVKKMQEMQEYSFWLAGGSIVLLFASLSTYAFSEYLLGHALVIFILCVLGSLLIFRRGILTLQDIRYKGTKYLDEILRAFDGGQAKEGEAGLVPPPNESYQDYVWRKKHIHKGGGYQYVYAVLRKGVLQFYRSKEAFEDDDDRLASFPLRYMKLTLDQADFSPDTGQVSFSLRGERFKRDRSLQFALLPLDDHEVLDTTYTAELQAVSKASFSHWINSLTRVEKHYKEANGNALTAVLENVS
mmetsp:Transcript_10463/g.15941  ORF Transcript_10463/g.15941 Transcript_10463/m.15941 type:complete len:355 (-) Transcript_10463:96-1160(-)|eukprot:CAMPEP_0185034270 /NCGR_PEP_ID=MMETSP1103-20130426/23983_1 /TAXON_ID=36769 /ORGANISM="Paraphysomonas bandaiensis, Strain Caron Lab Isolate" /LENGTH=354 /DNA_ID=CAMNT_0027570857 /DNA_START=61 /DNA_END=1125 /DNA_ORIENTATION=+